MKTTLLSPSEMVARGNRMYEETLRPRLEPQQNGKYLVINIDSGEYEIGETHIEASERAQARWPGVVCYATRVGYHGIAKFGAGFRMKAGEK